MLFLLTGIPVPVGFDQAHVMYVWFDALTNYLSGIHALVRDGMGHGRGRNMEGTAVFVLSC